MAAMRANALAISAAVGRAVDAGALTERAPPFPPGRAFVLGAGKAACPMARIAAARLGDRLAGGLVVVPDGYDEDVAGVTVRTAAHPVPDARSVAAGEALWAMVAAAHRDDLLVGVWSGGASSLVELPAEGVSLKALQDFTVSAMQQGQDIATLNAGRIARSRLKGGRLAAAGPARWHNLVLSDVAGDDPRLVGSGPTVRSVDDAVVIGSNEDAVRAAQMEAFALRYAVTVLDRNLRGPAEIAGTQLGAALRAVAGTGVPMALVLGGEPVVSGVPAGAVGGRLQELAVAAAVAIDGLDAVVLALATDGRDGNSDAMGAIVDGGTAARARDLGLSLAEALRAHDTTALLRATGDLLPHRPTRTNVRDVVVGLVR